MNKKTFFAIIPFLFFSANDIFAQQDPQFTQFIHNRQFFNPAVVGNKLETQFGFVYRTQWLAYQPTFDDGGAPSTQVFNFNTALPAYKSGIGFHLVNDNLGATNNIEAQLSYAYHIKMQNNGTLSFGVKAGIFNKTIDFGKLRFRESGDPFDLGKGKESNLKPDFGAGVYYENPKFFVGFSVNHLNQAKFNFGSATTQETLVQSSYLMGGYNFLFGAEKWILTPMLLVRNAQFNKYALEGGAIIKYNQKFWAGLSYRTQESANLLLGADFSRKTKKNVVHNMRVGYSFDYIIEGQTAKQATSHEITLGYTIPVKMPLPPSIIRTPRYRYN
jgi:type IX secretion system PorP/SprF family membrane protein